MADASSLRRKVRNRAASLVRDAGISARDALVRITPGRGPLRNDWTVDFFFDGTRYGARLRNNHEKPRPEWLEDSPPHVIMPRRAKALVFYWPRIGETVHAQRVNHPGVHLHYISNTLTADAWHGWLRLAQLQAR